MYIHFDSSDTTIIYIINSGSINENQKQRGSAPFFRAFFI